MLSTNTRKRQNVGAKLLRYMLGTLWPDPSPLLQEYRGGSLPQRPGLAGSDETGIASQNQLRYSTGHNLTTFPPHKD